MAKKKNKTSLSQSTSLQELTDFWDSHDLADFEGKTRDVPFKVKLKRVRRYVALDTELAQKIQNVARARGIRMETLVHLWLHKQINKVKTGKYLKVHLSEN